MGAQLTVLAYLPAMSEALGSLSYTTGKTQKDLIIFCFQIFHNLSSHWAKLQSPYWGLSICQCVALVCTQAHWHAPHLRTLLLLFSLLGKLFLCVIPDTHIFPH